MVKMKEQDINWITNLPDNVFPLTDVMEQYVHTYCIEVGMPPEPGQSHKDLFPLAKKYYRKFF